MSIKWELRNYLAKTHSIYSATEFKKLIARETGVIISLQNLCNYLNTRPKLIRPETIAIICSALKCNLNDFFRITPTKIKKSDSHKLSYKNTPRIKKGEYNFPNPKDY